VAGVAGNPTALISTSSN